MTTLAAVLMTALLISAQAPVFAQTETTPTAKPTKKHVAKKKAEVETESEKQIRELRELMQSQQAQIDALKTQLAGKDQQAAAAQQSAADAQTQAAAAATAAAQANAAAAASSSKADALSSSVTDLKTTTAGLQDTVVTNQKNTLDAIDSPSSIHYKGVTITPGGFAAAESVYRTRALNSDINTPFSSTPYMDGGQAHISEFNATGRQSRLAVLVTAPLNWGRAGAYYEMDFLSAGTTSNNNQSNSYTLRQREAWAQVATNSGFSMTGGQMWSLVTEVKKGIDEAPGTENLPNTIDPQYHVGFSWTRQYGVRFAQSFAGNKANIAFSLEGSQIVLASTTGAPDNFVFGSAGSTSGLLNSTGNGSAGAGGGAQNYSSNVAPDIIVKATFDPGYGHYEIGGAVRFFRDRVYSQSVYSTSVAGTGPGQNYTTPGGGFFVNLRFPVTKYIDLGVHMLEGPGMGRYGTANLGDVTVRPSGLLEPIRSIQGLGSIETHPFKKLDVYAYTGTEYLQRTVYTASTGALVGYGVQSAQNDTGCSTQAPPTTTAGVVPVTGGTCTGATRVVQEDSLGFTYRLFSSPSKGRIQYQFVYSYLTRDGWAGYTNGTSFATATTFGAPKATNNMFFTGMRYYIP